MAIIARTLRWLARLLGIGVLVGAGYAAFDYAKSRPRCVITTDKHIAVLSADGETVVTGYSGILVGNPTTSGDLQPPLRVWNTRTGALMRELFADVAAANPHRFRVRGSVVAAHAGDRTIRLADWQTGREWSISAPHAEVETVDISSAGRFLKLRLTCKEQEQVLIDVTDGRLMWSGNHDYFSPIFSPAGATVYLYSHSRFERWNGDTRQVEASRPIEPPLYSDRAGEVFAFWSSDERCIVVFDCTTLATKARLQPEFLRSVRPDWLSAKYVRNCLDLQFSPGGRWATALPASPNRGMSSSLKGPLEIWELSTGRRVASMPAYNPGFAWFPDDQCVCHGDMNEAQVIDPGTGRVKWECPWALGGLHVLNHTTAVHLTSKGYWDILDAETGRSRCRIAHPFTGPRECPLSFSKDETVVVGCGPRKESQLLAYWPKWLPALPAAKATAVQVIDVPAARLLQELSFNKHVGAAVSGDGSTLVCFDWIPDAPSAETTYSLRFYNLHSKEPWLWALAAPAALMATWLLWRLWRVRRQRNTGISTQTVGRERG